MEISDFILFFYYFLGQLRPLDLLSQTNEVFGWIFFL